MKKIYYSLVGLSLLAILGAFLAVGEDQVGEDTIDGRTCIVGNCEPIQNMTAACKLTWFDDNKDNKINLREVIMTKFLYDIGFISPNCFSKVVNAWVDKVPVN